MVTVSSDLGSSTRSRLRGFSSWCQTKWFRIHWSWKSFNWQAPELRSCSWHHNNSWGSGVVP